MTKKTESGKMERINKLSNLLDQSVKKNKNRYYLNGIRAAIKEADLLSSAPCEEIIKKLNFSLDENKKQNASPYYIDGLKKAVDELKK